MQESSTCTTWRWRMRSGPAAPQAGGVRQDLVCGDAPGGSRTTGSSTWAIWRCLWGTTLCCRCAAAANRTFWACAPLRARAAVAAPGRGLVFYALMDAVVDRYFPLIDDFESELEQIEQDIFEHGTARGSIERLYALKRPPRCCAMRWRR